MPKTTIYEKVKLIQDETIAKLESLRIPAYPSNYKKYFEEIYNSDANQSLRNALRADTSVDEKMEAVSKYLELAKVAIDSFEESHNHFSAIAQQQQKFIESITPDPSVNAFSLVSGLTQLGESMASELQMANHKINSLNTRLNDSIHEMQIDSLTHLFNHKVFVDEISKRLTDSKSSNADFSVLLVDADEFQKINSVYGQTAGDKVLYFLAQTLRLLLGQESNLFRYGADQFAVILDEQSNHELHQLCEKIRFKIEHSNLIYSGSSITLTVSIAGTFFEAGDSYETIIDRINLALNSAKKNGRNQIVFYPPI